MQTTILKMNAQIEKFKLIEWLVNLQDMTTLKRLDELRRESEVAAYEAGLKPMTQEELIARAQAANEDIEAGRLYSRKEVETGLGL